MSADITSSPKPADPRGCLFIVSAPSGAGKTTLCRQVRLRLPELIYSVSTTTRPPRAGEREGIDYFFTTTEVFQRQIDQDEWAEWAQVYGHYYGTSATFIDTQCRAGRDVLLDIDVQGTIKLLRRFPDSVTIFVRPPSWAVLEARLRQRGTDDEATIARRLAAAREEMQFQDRYRYVVVNDDLQAAVERLVEIISAQRHYGKSSR